MCAGRPCSYYLQPQPKSLVFQFFLAISLSVSVDLKSSNAFSLYFVLLIKRIVRGQVEDTENSRIISSGTLNPRNV